MRRILLTLVLLSPLACSAAEGPRPATTPSTTAAAPARLVVGEQHRFAIDWQVDSDVERGMMGDVPLHGGVRLRGSLALRVHEADADGVWIGVALLRVDEAVIDVFGADVLDDPAVLVGHEALVHVDADGGTRDALFAADTPSVARHVLAGVLAQLDLRVPGPNTLQWQRVAPTGAGLARVDYTRQDTDGTAIERRVLGYERIDALPGAGVDAPWEIDAHASLRLDDRGLPLEIAAVEILALRGEEQPVAFRTHARFDLDREGDATAIEPRPRAARTGLVSYDLHAPPDDTEAERELARRFAEGLTSTDLLLAVHAAGHGVRPPPGLLARARGLLRGWPEQAAELAPMYRTASDATGRAFVLDLLSSAGTDVAQRLMVSLLRHSLEHQPDELPRLVAHTSLIEQPLSELVQTVLAMHDDAVARGEPALRRASLYPLGAMAGRMGATDPMLAERVLATVRHELDGAVDPAWRRAALASLGNAAMPEDLDRVLAHIDERDPELRADAVAALRHFDDARATEATFAALADPERRVASMALGVIDQDEPSPAELTRLALVTIAGSHHAGITGELIGVLSHRGRDHSLARAALASLWPRVADVRTRVRIGRLLG